MTDLAQSNRAGALTSRAYWDASSHAGLRLTAPVRSEFQPIFDRYLPKDASGCALEIGACPGVHLGAVARSHGYKPVALDFLPRVHTLKDAFAEVGLPEIETIQADFLAWESDRRFALVMSLGFIEHFGDPVDVVRRHWRLVDEGGCLVIGLPLFGPAQLWLRRCILPSDMLERILATHNLSATNVAFLAKTCAELPGARTLFGGPVWQMHTWFRLNEAYIGAGGKAILAAWKTVAVLPRLLRWSSPVFSPYALFIVRREGTQGDAP